MRFALRNKSRIRQTYGDDFCNEMMCCLKKYFQLNQDIPRVRKDGYTHEFISVPGSNGTLMFAIVCEKYDVLTLAYFPYKESN